MIRLVLRLMTLLIMIVWVSMIASYIIGNLLPDSGQITYQLQHGRTRSLYLMDIARHLSHELVRGSDPFPNYAWSPDGRQLAYVSRVNEDADIFRLDVACATLFTICASPTNLTNFREADAEPAWSPDGTAIVFVADRGGTPELYWMPASGGEALNLTNDSATDSFPMWSPDGRYIAFYSDREGSMQVYVMDMSCLAAVETCHTMTRLIGGGFNSYPAWSPDSQQLAYFSNGDILLAAADCGKAGKGCDAEARNLTRSISTDWFPVWSPDGKHMYFQSTRDQRPQIYSINADCDAEITECSQLLNTGLIYSLLPTFSPDGQQIALNSIDTGFAELYLIPQEGMLAQRLTFTGGQVSNARWRPHLP